MITSGGGCVNVDAVREPISNMEAITDDSDDDAILGFPSFNPSSESSDSDNKFNSKKKKKTKKFTVRNKSIEKTKHQNHNHNQNKYKIWSNGLQEETLTQNLQGCDVTNENKYNRDVESYDFSLKYRLNGENKLKRRQSYTYSDDDNESDTNSNLKRHRGGGGGGGGHSHHNHHNHHNRGGDDRRNHKSVKSRLGGERERKPSGSRSKNNDDDDCDESSNSNSNERFNQAPRFILDLTTTIESESDAVATDIANKLCEEKDDLLLRIVNTIGKAVPMEIFRETQKIESDGGMLIMNGQRRRTPGGVFLFLLKRHDTISKADKKTIFAEERKTLNKEKKIKQNQNREKKVEELKKTLKKDNKDLPALLTRNELIMSHLKPEAQYSSECLN